MKRRSLGNQQNRRQYSHQTNPTSPRKHQQIPPYTPPEHKHSKPKIRPLLPVTVIEELRNRVIELEIQLAVADTMTKLERIRRQNLINELLEATTMSKLEELKSAYRPRQRKNQIFDRGAWTM